MPCSDDSAGSCPAAVGDFVPSRLVRRTGLVALIGRSCTLHDSWRALTVVGGARPANPGGIGSRGSGHSSRRPRRRCSAAPAALRVLRHGAALGGVPAVRLGQVERGRQALAAEQPRCGRRVRQRIGGQHLRGQRVGRALVLGECRAPGTPCPSSTSRRAAAGSARRRRARAAAWSSPSASKVNTHSAVSAAVTQSPVDTQRTPRPSMTNVDQPSAMRRRPASPSSAPDSIG